MNTITPEHLAEIIEGWAEQTEPPGVTMKAGAIVRQNMRNLARDLRDGTVRVR